MIKKRKKEKQKQYCIERSTTNKNRTPTFFHQRKHQIGKLIKKRTKPSKEFRIGGKRISKRGNQIQNS